MGGLFVGWDGWSSDLARPDVLVARKGWMRRTTGVHSPAYRNRGA